MDHGEGALEELALLWVGLQPTPSNVEYLRQGNQFALLDLHGADLICALTVLPGFSADHTGVGTVCGELAVSAHASAQCLLGFGGNPERAHAVLYSAEEAVKTLQQVDLKYINHSKEMSNACTAVRLADRIVRLVQDYHNNHECCTNQICSSFLAPVQETLTDLWRQ